MNQVLHFTDMEVVCTRDVADRRKRYWFVWDEDAGWFALVEYGPDRHLFCHCPDGLKRAEARMVDRWDLPECPHERATVAVMPPSRDTRPSYPFDASAFVD